MRAKFVGKTIETRAGFVSDAPSQNSLLRFITCGSVDDGKSTLIGRLLHGTNSLYDDELVTLEQDSQRYGTADSGVDYALLLDGLQAEREQGITIDVAYRFMSTPRRKFIVADCPGHEEYTRNMATGASTADLAIFLVDARQGIVSQTRRHAYIAALLGIQHVIFAVNKMDLVEFDELRFLSISSSCRDLAETLGIESIFIVPVSAKFGDNITVRSTRTPWYAGKTVLEHLEAVPIDVIGENRPFRFPVQLVIRPDSTFRGFAGQIASGRVGIGDEVVVAVSGARSRVREIVTKDVSLHEAKEGNAITLVLEDEIDVSRGSLLVSPGQAAYVADQLQAHIIWFDHAALIPGRSYLLQTENDMVSATVSSLRYEINVHTFAHEAAKSLSMNCIGVCNLSLQRAIAFDAYKENRITGNFVLLDRFTNATVGAGMIDFPLRRSLNLRWHVTSITNRERSEIKSQNPMVVWFTGLSGSGKSTIANAVETLLYAEGKHTYLLDGDNLRHGLNRDLGFTSADRVENIRRVAETAKLMADAGLIVLVASISPFAAERRFARELMDHGRFIEVFVDTPIEECARRDPKGLYRKAAVGEISNFTGVTSPYEVPECPDIHIHTIKKSVDEIALDIVSRLSIASNALET